MRRRSGNRRQLATVLFTDIVGSTERAAALGDRAWRQLLDRHHRVVRRILRRHDGHEVDTAGDGFFATFTAPVDAISCAVEMMDALAALDRETFAVAILDIGLPGMDGYELLAAIRSRPKDGQRDIPAAALTAYARAIDRTRSLQAGFQLHLSKPIEPNELAAAVLALSGRIRDHLSKPG